MLINSKYAVYMKGDYLKTYNYEGIFYTFYSDTILCVYM